MGLAFLTPALVLTQQHFGWQGVFFLTGAIGLAWGVVWYALYREPSEAAGVNEAELETIRAGGGLVELGTNDAPARVTAPPTGAPCSATASSGGSISARLR